METCNKCQEICGFYYKRQYRPDEYILGKKNSQILIIGINPKGDIGENNIEETVDDLRNNPMKNSYFDKIRKISEIISKNIGVENGVAHTDLLKCFSNNFPPQKLNRGNIHRIIINCRPYLIRQLEKGSFKLVICNGFHVNWHIEQIIQPIKDHDTYYIGEFLGRRIAVLRSGFIGRIDNYAKRRLGKEVELLMDEMGIIF